MEKTARKFSGLLCAAVIFAAVCAAFFGGVLPLNAGAAAEAAAASAAQRPMLVACGTPFGIKLKTDGVLAVGITENSPAEKAGLRQGDVIISVNGKKVCSNSNISAAIQLYPESCKVIIRRSDSERMLDIQPYCEGGVYRIGVWVRDSAAGIGTMTYYNPATGGCGGLGHAVSDVTTGELMPLLSGEITAAEINGIVKGAAGAPGELCGRLIADSVTGAIERNTQCGIFGSAAGAPVSAQAIPMAYRSEVRTGAATMLTTIDGGTPAAYDIEIEHISVYDTHSSKSMTIRITDPLLLEKTGGIVCGMSGSPIIQDGKLVGAVTHVFLNDPQRGYAIFCQTMLENSCE